MKPSSPHRIASIGITLLFTTGLQAETNEVPPAKPASKDKGNASFYAKRLAGQKTASGEPYDPAALTAAHRTLPLGTKVKVVNPKNQKSVVVTVNDRGPVPKSRILDVSSAAADALDMKKSGVTKVETEVVGKTDAPAK
jgi:rare lipoprotein A